MSAQQYSTNTTPGFPKDQSAGAPTVELLELGPDVSISYGDGTRTNTEDPRVIVLFGWMDAPTRLMTKYAMNHRYRWPSSDIAIVQSHPAFIWTSEEGRDEKLRPLANYLVSKVYRQPERAASGILLHVISNGGAFQLITLSRVLHSIVSSSSDIPRRNIRLATIIDSAPGTGEYSSLLTTLTTGVKSPAVKALTNVPVTLFYLVVRLRRAALGEENLFTDLHSRLQSPDLLPRSDSLAPRLYIYSIADAMVPFASVEKHISVLQSRSSAPFDIAVEKFTTSQHVLHERHDPARYWSAVRAVWERSAPVRTKL
ncbi:hypothetical protein B0H17DRAFT_1199937 [Mycena rosella]|uniref:DUF829-domain-containing protein n=1 Tax=Mycena rosella TaxID=1033263 RepID=A0AAD7DJU7_MYCRO|nr:hypothetical protein B0H17DRAFT_1199937 [Mycena rosella]